MIERFKEKCRQILWGLWEERPVDATYLGVHNFDSLLPRTDKSSRAAYRKQRIHFLAGLKEFHRRRQDLPLDRQIDLDLMTTHLEAELYVENVFELLNRRADVYPSEALNGVYILAMRKQGAHEQNMESILNRLGEIPRLLNEAMDNLRTGTNIPSVWTDHGLQVTLLGIEFFEKLVPRLAKTSQGMKSDLLKANFQVVNAFRRYQKFIQDELSKKSIGSFAIGEEAFDFLLRKRHHLEYTAREIRDIGEKMVATVKNLLEKQANEISPGARWNTVVDSLKNDHPEPDALLETYRNEVSKVREFVDTHQIVSIPQAQKLLVRETPPFYRLTIPYAAFVPPAPFEKDSEGIFWVTPVDETLNDEQRQDRLKGHSIWSIPVTALHETIPGHHLQLSHACAVKSAVKRYVTTSVFIEGWALYCEEMMKDEGFIDDPRLIVMQLKDQLWRALRVVIDTGLHCFGMKISEAVKLLVEEAGLEKHNAIAEVNRYTMHPTQPMSYMIGKLELMNLRNDIEKLEGERFDQRWFHDQLLSYGSIPVSMVRALMLEEIENFKR
jgi:uncharacterized protein (DUF885 family)